MHSGRGRTVTRLETFRGLTSEIDGVEKPLIVLALLKLWNLVCELFPLFLYSALINKILVEKKIEILWAVILGYFLVFVFLTIGISLSKKFSNRLLLKYDMKVKCKLLKKYMAIDSKAYNVGDIKTRIENDSIVAGNFFITHILDFGYSIIYAIVLACILICYDWRIAFLSFIFIPVAFLVIDFFGKKTKQTGEELRKLQTMNETFLHTTFQNWKDVKINNLEEIQFDELNRQYKRIRRIWFLNQLYLHVGITFSFFTKNFITQLYIYFIGGFFVICGYSRVGALLVFVKFYEQFFGCIQAISNSMMNYKNDFVKIEKVVEILNIDTCNKPYKKIEESDVVVEDLEFAYKGNEFFGLKNISFAVRKGEHLAIVGASGSGKSTIAKLLTGQLKPHNGIINIGNVNINEVDSKSLYDKISIIVQEPMLFNMTIKENFMLVKDSVTDQELIECCRRASIYDFIETLPDKFETIIGEKGVKLSGGQKQRLAIARAFLQNRDIIIFDESTSALDSEKEQDIITEIKCLASEKTLISIAHRLSSILDCDKVMVIKDGRIMALDTHENLRNKDRNYDLLFENQYIIS